MKLKIFVGVILGLLIGPTLSLADIRDTVSGLDGAFYKVLRDPVTSTVRVQRNGVTHVSPSSLQILSEPAITRARDALHIVVRGPGNVVYCTCSFPPYTSWIPWTGSSQYTSDQPAVVSNSSGTQVWTFVRHNGFTPSIFFIYHANLYGCPSSTNWINTQIQIGTSPPWAVADSSGIYVRSSPPA